MDSRVQSADDLMRLAHEDPKYIIERGFFVINKEKETVPFIFNEPQQWFYDEMTTRDDYLKAGQLGISTVILAILTVKFLLVPNAWCVCISHEAEATKRLFDKVDFYLKNLPDWLKVFYKPERDSQQNLVNGVMNSRFYIGTAGARAFGRGDTIHYAHLSESSRWSDDGRIMTGIIRAVPLNDPHTWIVKETTANGAGTLHHQEYMRAKDRANSKSEFTAHFIPWFANPAYRVEGAKIPEQQRDEEERQLLNRFPYDERKKNKGHVDDAALAWRRQMIGNLVSEQGWTPEQMFKQEFPADDVEAFLFSGNPFFPVRQLQIFKSSVKAPILVGNLLGVTPNEIFDETDRGYLRIYEMPEADGQYEIGGDVARSGDYSSAHVVNKKTWEVVATWHGHIGASQFGDELNRLGHFYNEAELIIEANNMGQSTIDRLVELMYPYLYKRQIFNKETKKATNEYGWWTDLRTRPIMLGYLQEIVRTQRPDLIPDEPTIDEMLTFIKNDNGKPEAAKGCYDDRVMSCGLAFYGMKLNPYREKNVRKQPKQSTPGARYRRLRSRSGRRSIRGRAR